ncbi:hypothetical protein RYX36_011004, partial [Vicia faba]
EKHGRNFNLLQGLLLQLRILRILLFNLLDLMDRELFSNLLSIPVLVLSLEDTFLEFLLISFKLHSATRVFSSSLTQELITSQLKKQLLGIFPQLLSVTLILLCDMLTLEFLPTTKR